MIRRFIGLFCQAQAGWCKVHLVTGIAALFLVFSGDASRVLAQSQSGFTYNGMVYVSYQANEYQETPQGPQGTAAIRATGANYASVVVTQYEQTSTANTIAPETTSTPGYNSSADPLSPTDAAVTTAIQNLQAQGLTVVMKPQVDSLDGVFRGDFAPTNTATWFASYQTFIMHYAQLAVTNNVGYLIIGTELKSLSGSAYETYWDNIIAQIRASYPSLTLIYGANATGAGDEFTTVSFWDKVDIIGVDGYFPLTNHADPTVAQLVAAWSDNKSGFNVVSALQALQSQYNKPLIFTELGYVSAPGTNEAPYSSAAAGATSDPTEQQNCYEAFFEVFSQQTSWMKGVFWWAWNVSPPGSNDTGYTPQNKPAATVTLPKWYGSTTQGFTLAPSNSSLTLGEGLATTDTIAVTSLGGFTGAVTLAAAGLPSGVSASFAAGTATGTQLMTLTATNGATIGTTNVTVTGTSGSLTAVTAITVNIQAPEVQSITFNNPGAQTVGIPLTLSATASSGLAVTFVSSTTNVCTVSGPQTSFLTAGICTLTASQSGNSIYSAATPVPQSFNVGALPPVPVPAADEVLVSQLNWLDSLNGNAFVSGNPAGSSFAVNSNGQIAVANASNLVLFNSQTGAATTLGAWASASAAAIDSQNNIYVSNLYGPVYGIVKLPYVGGTANAGYAAFTTPTASLSACTSSGTTECSLSRVGAINAGAMAFDTAGDLFWVTASSGATSGNGIYECSVACLAGTGSPVQLYQEPTASTPPSTSSGQLLVGGLAIDPWGNVFFTDSSVYVNSTFAITSFYSSLKELSTSTGTGYGGATTGYAATPSTLYTVTPSPVGQFDNELDAVAVSPTSGTVYFADGNDGVFAFPNTGSLIPVANGQPTALYMVSTQGAKTLSLDAQGNLYFAQYSTVINSGGGDTLGQITLDKVSVPVSPVGTASSPSAVLNPVSTIVNDAGCSSNPAASATFVAVSSSTATATLSTTGGCSSTLTGGGNFATAISFTPTVAGADSISLTAADQASDTSTVTVTGGGLGTQTITFNNPGAQLVGTPLMLTATATSGLTVTFTSTTTSVCTISNTTATFLTTGTCTIDADQAGNSYYPKAPQVPQSFTVNAVPSFTLAPTTSALSVTRGSSATDTITVTGANGFTGGVTLGATGLPSGVTANFATNPTTGSSGITFTAGSTATTGTVTVTISGTSGTLSASTTINLTVNAAPSFTLAPMASALSVTPGSSATDTITVSGANGFTGNVSLVATGLPSGVTASLGTNPTSGSSVLTLTAGSSATAGTVTVTITGTSGSLSASTTIALSVNAAPSFTLAAAIPALSVMQGNTASDTITVTGANGFTSSVTLAASGLPSGVTASFGTNPTTGASGLMLTVGSAATIGSATVTITGTAGSITSSTTIALTINAPPILNLAPTTSAVSVVPGGSASDTVTVTGTGGFTGSVSLTAVVTSAPQGATDVPSISFGSTSPVTVAGGGSGAATLTVSTTAPTSGAVVLPSRTAGRVELAGAGFLGCVLLLGILAKRRRWPVMLAMLACLFAFTSALVGCGSSGASPAGGGSGTTPGTYVVTVTATAAGAATATLPVTITVQ